MSDVADGLVAVVKRDCPTCDLVQPVLREPAVRFGDTGIVSRCVRIPARLEDPNYRIPKFLPEGLNVVAAGGEAGMNSAIIGGLSMEIGMTWGEMRN